MRFEAPRRTHNAFSGSDQRGRCGFSGTVPTPLAGSRVESRHARHQEELTPTEEGLLQRGGQALGPNR